ncbi:hypothetical protein B0T26DRAFT_678741 [Lasiosphaeria miniovina]|uniref:Transcription factor domain-containing protein n=1 Tax=Lasiosphaeria miniovina TaxID=1954250 RepID=A0AA40A4T0_9PEZI|nr:uncharacterized protein B0T26DRAFT_678741 [Lasiosphaeria miniovina]KAK0709299.1 hypothetical protein B0T26DRAFT_678741 [Lasiosphaeria miniovina]
MQVHLSNCQPSVPVRGRDSGKRQHISRTAQLQGKLEDLVTLLRSQALPISPVVPSDTSSASASHADDNSPVFTPAASTSQSTSSRPETTPDGSLAGSGFEPTPHRPVLHLPGSPIHPSVPSWPHQPTDEEAEENLDKFRNTMLISMPIVYLPPSMTAKQLREQYPFLWFNIMTITCKGAARQFAMSDAILAFVAQKMVIEFDRDMDLLLGLLIYMGWKQYQRKGKRCLSLITSLAKSIVYDLGLNRANGETIACLALSVSEGKRAFSTGRELTTEGRRAVLACFLITSHISFILKKIDALNWTPEMDESLQILSEQPEWEGDEMLVAQVKIQLVFEQLTRATRESPDDGVSASYLFALQSELQTIKAQFPAHVQQNDVVKGFVYFTEHAIQEMASLKPKISKSIAPDLRRYEALEARVRTIQNLFDMHLSMPSRLYGGLTFMYWCHLINCIISLYQLSVYDDPGWDRRALRNRIDIFDLCDRITHRFDEVATARLPFAGPNLDDDVFVSCSKMMLTLKEHWLMEFAALERGNIALAAPLDGVAYGGMTDAPPPTPVLQLDESEVWLSDLFNMNWEM